MNFKSFIRRRGIFLEPSALAGFLGPVLFGNKYNATHICWATGGSLVPEYVRKEYVERA